MTGIFLGSFDPPHIGHLSIVSGVLETGLRRVIVVPAYHNPWKPEQTPWELRYRMADEAFSGYGNKVLVSTIEGSGHILKQYLKEDEQVDLEDGIPSFLTIRYFNTLYKENLRIIVTPETFTEIHKWKNSTEVYQNNFILVCPRGQREIQPQENVYPVLMKNNIEISSTIIRNWIKEGKMVNEYLPRYVNEIIKQHNLYE